MSGEDPGLLGNLPRSRPGTRSQKRASGRATTSKAGSAPKAKAKPATKRAAPKRTTPKAGAPKRSTAAKTPPPRPAAPPPAEESHDAVGDALRGAAKAANAGLRVANGVTREVLRRLPRP